MSINSAYEEVLRQVRLLSLEDQARLLEELAAIVREHSKNQQYHSIMELKGLGKDLWQSIAVEKYLEEERSSWRSDCD